MRARPRDGGPGPPTRSGEDDGALPVEQHAVLGVPAHGAGQHPSLDVLAARHHLGDVVGVGDPLDVLLDDRALVQVAR